MTVRLGDDFRIIKGKDGRTRIEPDEAKKLAKLDVSTRIARKKSKRVRVKRGPRT